MSSGTEETLSGFESLVAYIEDLPPLPESVQRVQALYAKGEPEIPELVRLIESDPILTADILARVNAPLYSFSKHIVSVMQAITLFGTSSIRGFVLSSAMNRSFEIDMRPYNISNEEFSKICSLQSTLMFQWYMGVDIEHVKFLVPAAFLMEMGKVVIATEVNNSDYTELFQNELNNTVTVETTEKAFTDMTSAEVGSLLFRHWYFDESFVAAMRYLDDRDKAPTAVKMYIDALNVVRKAVNVKEQLSENSIEEAALILKGLGLDEERFIKTARRLQKNK